MGLDIYFRLYLQTNGEKGDLINLLTNTFLNEEKSTSFLLDLLKVTSLACCMSEEMLMLDVFKNHIDDFEYVPVYFPFILPSFFMLLVFVVKVLKIC